MKRQNSNIGLRSPFSIQNTHTLKYSNIQIFLSLDLESISSTFTREFFVRNFLAPKFSNSKHSFVIFGAENFCTKNARVNVDEIDTLGECLPLLLSGEV
jgi:hypothetical protein